MNTNQRKGTVLGAAAAMGVVLFLAGCGSDSSGGGSDSGATNGTTSGPAESGPSSMPDPYGAPPATGGSDGAGKSEAPSEQLVVVIKDFAFEVPDSVPAGATITVRNDDSVGHTMTSDEDGVFDVPVGPGEEAEITVPSEPGEYPFHCTPHPDMTATLVVK